MSFEFFKYEGLGNDFIVAEASEVELSADLAERLCDRHRGIGADGVLLIGRGEGLSMTVWNADGSKAQMCGNGLRCVAWHVVRQGGPSQDVWQTDAGPHATIVHGDGDVEVSMAIPSFEPSSLPVLAKGPLIDASMAFEGRDVRLTAVSMGNPHAVLFEDFDHRQTLGPAIAAHPDFPEGVNVGFARAIEGGFELHVLERGSGWTMACGTGACAAVAAAVRTGRALSGKPTLVRLPGGELIIQASEDRRVSMRGPARHVFHGSADFDGGLSDRIDS